MPTIPTSLQTATNHTPSHLPSPKQSRQLQNKPSSAALNVEKEAQQRIFDTQKQVESAQQAGETRITSLREQYADQYELEAAKREGILEKQKDQGYAALRNQKRAQQNELNELRREGEKEYENLKAYYEKLQEDTGAKGEKNLQQIQTNTANLSQYEQKNSQLQQEMMKTENQRVFHQIKSENDEKLQQLSEDIKQQHDNTQETYLQANSATTQHLQDNYQKTLNNHNQTLAKLYTDANEQVQQIKSDTARKLAAYNIRQKDPFYQLVDINADLEENHDEYVLYAHIPAHEQDQISVSVKDNQVVISGKRLNETQVNVEPGHSKGTHSYQSFSESFPLGLPVEPQLTSREWSGETLIVRIPKKSYPKQSVKTAEISENKLIKPQFPDNLIPRERDQQSAKKTNPLG